MQSRFRKLRVSFLWTAIGNVKPDLRMVWSGESINGRIAYRLRSVTAEDHDISPESTTLAKSRQVFRARSWCWREKSYLSYADELRKEMTKPNTVPNTVINWFEILKGVNQLTADTTAERC